nr:MAG TPA: hypothetical protein [Crassvirales sp.]
MRIDLSKIKLQLKVAKTTKKVVSKEIPPKKLTKLINGKVVLKDGIILVLFLMTNLLIECLAILMLKK